MIPDTLTLYAKEMGNLQLDYGCIFRGEKFLIPQAMRKDLIQTFHSTHQRFDLTWARAKERAWWPTIKNDVRMAVEACQSCQEGQASQQREPHLRHAKAKQVFERLHTDYCTEGGKDWLIVIDEYTHFPYVYSRVCLKSKC